MLPPAGLQDSLDRLMLHWRYGDRPLPLMLLHAARNRLWYRREKRVYVYEAEKIAGLPNPLALQRDREEDLRFYERTDSWQMTAEDYRRAGRIRLERGEHLYTIVENGRLLHYAWLKPRHQREEDVLVGRVFFPAPDSAALYDHHTHPLARRRGLYSKAICQLLHDARLAERAQRAYIYVYADNLASRRAIEKVGFRYVGSMVQEGRLATVRRYVISAGGEFPTELL